MSAGERRRQGQLWFDRLALKPVATRCAHSRSHVRAHRHEASGNRARWPSTARASTIVAKRANRLRGQTFEIDLQAVREFGGIEIDWARGLNAPRYSIETSLDGSRWNKVRKYRSGQRRPRLAPDAGVGGALHTLTMPDPGRDVGIAELHVRDLEFGASPNAFIQSLAKQRRRGCYPRPYLRRAELLDDRRGGRRQRGEHAVRGRCARSPQGQLFGRAVRQDTRYGWLTWADVAIEHSLADGYLPIPSVEWQHRAIELTTTAYASGAGRQLHRRMRSISLRNPDAGGRKSRWRSSVRPIPGQSAGAVPQHCGRREPDPGSRVREGRVSVDKVPSVFPRLSATSISRGHFAADTPCEWSPSNWSAQRARRERLRVGCTVVRRRSARRAEQESCSTCRSIRGAKAVPTPHVTL